MAALSNDLTLLLCISIQYHWHKPPFTIIAEVSTVQYVGTSLAAACQVVRRD
jgi:hypothetical protein